MRDVLRHRDLRLLLAAQATSQAADWLYDVALVVWLIERTGSPAWVAAASLVRLLPWIVLSPLAGVVADRVDRRRVIAGASALQALAMLALAAVAASGADPVLVLLISGVASVGTVLVNPAVYAAVPELVEERSLAAANSLLTSIISLSLVVGPAVGGVLLLLGSPEAAFAANALLFAGAAMFAARIRSSIGPARPAAAPAHAPAHAPVTRTAGLAHELASGIRALGASSATAAAVLLLAAVWFASGLQGVLWAVLADEHLAAGADAVTILWVAFGLGGLAGAVPSARLARSGSIRRRLAVAAAVAGGTAAVLAPVTSLGPAFALLAAQGAATAVVDVLVITRLQRLLGPAVLGRAMGAVDSATSIAMVAGSLAAPVLIAVGGLGAGFIVTGLAFVLAGAGVVLARSGAAGAAAAPEARVRLLGSLSIFAGAPPYAIEGLASAAREVRVPAGTTVIRAGDPADALFVLVEGGAAVTTAEGTLLNTLGAGDYLGEIGIVKGVPRTATVTTTTPATLLRIEAAAFLALIRDGAVARGALGRGVGARLARGRATA